MVCHMLAVLRRHGFQRVHFYVFQNLYIYKHNNIGIIFKYYGIVINMFWLKNGYGLKPICDMPRETLSHPMPEQVSGDWGCQV